MLELITVIIACTVVIVPLAEVVRHAQAESHRQQISLGQPRRFHSPAVLLQSLVTSIGL